MNPSWIKRKIVRKTNNSQLEFLIKEMQLHPDLTKPYPIQKFTRVKYEKLWLSLADQLNALGPPHKTITEWKRVWSDLKARLKTRVRKKCKNAEVIDILRHLHPPDEVESDHVDYMELQIEHIDQSKKSLAESCNKVNATFSQMEVLLKELDKSPRHAFANQFEKEMDRKAHDAFWSNLTKKLNEMGPPVRELDEWKQVCANYEVCEKSKAEDINVHNLTKMESEFKHIEDNICRLDDIDSFSLDNDVEEITCNQSEPILRTMSSTTDEIYSFDDPLHSPQAPQASINVSSFNFTESMEERFLRLLERQTAAIERQAVATEAILELLKQQKNC